MIAYFHSRGGFDLVLYGHRDDRVRLPGRHRRVALLVNGVERDVQRRSAG